AEASPAWVYPWMNIAVLRARLGLMDGQLFHAYHQAVKTGPWERNTMAPLVSLGATVHRFATPEQKHFIEQYINRVATANGPLIASYLRQRGSRPFICRGLKQMQLTQAYKHICSG
ncbi:MAG: hypothetical protein Q9M17_01555, partial [Mariprofundus sp.]|nr:hypothetical protein [Mariprofundus sp.]